MTSPANQAAPTTPDPGGKRDALLSLAPAAAAWFCVRTRPKQEHIAAAQLRQFPGLEVFLPRIRYQRPTRSGPRWTSEALFLNYLFARFDLAASLRRVQAARGVSAVVHFGSRWPTIPDSVITELRAAVGDGQVKIVTQAFGAGDAVQIAGGVFHGLQAVVSRVMPGRQRVAVLLDFLGRQTAVELDRSRLVGSRRR